jgi:hypothetical protein
MVNEGTLSEGTLKICGVRMESNHLGYDSTAQFHQDTVVATRYPLFVQRKVSLPLTIQIKKEGERRFLLLTINTLNRRLWLRKIIHCRQPLVFWQPLSCSFGNLWVVYPLKACKCVWCSKEIPLRRATPRSIDSQL